MRHTTTMNMTEGRPLVLLTVFALPLLIGNVFQQAYNLADSMIVGRMLGANALAAVGATGSISFLFFSIFNGISGGCGIVTAQYFGARNDRMVCKSIANSAYIYHAGRPHLPPALFLLAQEAREIRPADDAGAIIPLISASPYNLPCLRPAESPRFRSLSEACIRP